ncbi:MAG: hypothetical protein FWC80_05475 [Firmicutes bacterium]|nr:hypothetical protein [Bacillota bacterium]
MKKMRLISMSVFLALLMAVALVFGACDNDAVPPNPPPPAIEYSQANRVAVSFVAERALRVLTEREGSPEFLTEFEEVAGDRILDALKEAGVTDEELGRIIAVVKEEMQEERRENREIGEEGEEESVEDSEEEEKEEDEEEKDEEHEKDDNDNKEVTRKNKLQKANKIFEKAEVSEQKFVDAVYHIIRTFDDIIERSVAEEYISERMAVSIFAARDNIDKQMIKALVRADEKSPYVSVIAKGKILYAAINADGGLTDEDLEKRVQSKIIKYGLEVGIDAEEIVDAMRNWAEYVSSFDYDEEISEIAFDSIFVRFVKELKDARHRVVDGEEIIDEENQEATETAELPKGIEEWKEYPAVHMPKG